MSCEVVAPKLWTSVLYSVDIESGYQNKNCVHTLRMALKAQASQQHSLKYLGKDQAHHEHIMIYRTSPEFLLSSNSCDRRASVFQVAHTF